jgi:hypothetical protein
MKPDDNRQEPRDDSDPSGEGRDSAASREDVPQVVLTTDPAVAQGRANDFGPGVRPDETIVAETSRVNRAVPGYVSQSNPFVEPEGANSAKPKKQNGKSQDDRPQSHDDDRNHDQPKHDDQKSGSPWVSYAINAVVALACGLGGALAFSYFDASKGGDPSKQQAKTGGDDNSKKQGGDSSKGEKGKGKQSNTSEGGSPSENTGSKDLGVPEAENPQTFRKEFQLVASRLDTLQQRLDLMAMPASGTPPDLAALRVKVGELSGILNEVANLPSLSRQMENRMDQLQLELKGLRDRGIVASNRDQTGSSPPILRTVARSVDTPAGEPPIPPPSPNSADQTMVEGMALFKQGQYPLADDLFRKLQTTNPQDARVWYFSALAHGFATGRWDGETRRLVEQGAQHERNGKPSASEIDAAFAGLSPAQGKVWLNAYRVQLVHR